MAAHSKGTSGKDIAMVVGMMVALFAIAGAALFHVMQTENHKYEAGLRYSVQVTPESMRDLSNEQLMANRKFIDKALGKDDVIPQVAELKIAQIDGIILERASQ